ncbi:MAG: hypothetical protein LBL45_01515, partial [Treponema sp.]|nr:hypothetical protein [Treponema sp.]
QSEIDKIEELRNEVRPNSFGEFASDTGESYYIFSLDGGLFDWGKYYNALVQIRDGMGPGE